MYKKIYIIMVVFLFSLAASCSDKSSSSAEETGNAGSESHENVGLEAAENMVSQGESAADSDDKYQEGLQYGTIQPAQDTDSKPGRIEVVEMFFYACPHCYKLDPTIEKWASTLADDVDFKRIPAIIGPTWAEQAKAFYIAEELGMADDVRKKLFDSIHIDGKQYYNEYTLMTFFNEQGVDTKRFLELYESEEIMKKASDARVKTVRYGIRGVPAIIVNGKYYAATYFTRNHEEMLDIVDYLIDKERKELVAKLSN